MCQRSITCAGVLSCAAAISPMTGFSKVDVCGPSLDLVHSRHDLGLGQQPVEVLDAELAGRPVEGVQRWRRRDSRPALRFRPP
jgi:hypothetical protein